MNPEPSFLADHDGFILDSQQYAALDQNRFFMRVEFKGAGDKFPVELSDLSNSFAETADRFAMDWTLVSNAEKPNIIVAVSKGSHCLNDLLYRWKSGALPVDIVAVVSNHENLGCEPKLRY